jgi:hypothetical protein
MGCMIENTRTGAATLEIHMLANVATNIVVRTIDRGRLMRDRIDVAAAFAM